MPFVWMEFSILYRGKDTYEFATGRSKQLNFIIFILNNSTLKQDIFKKWRVYIALRNMCAKRFELTSGFMM